MRTQFSYEMRYFSIIGSWIIVMPYSFIFIVLIVDEYLISFFKFIYYTVLYMYMYGIILD